MLGINAKNTRTRGTPMFETLESRVLLTTVAYWRFDNGTAGAAAPTTAGSIIDSSGNGHNGTAFNGPVYSTSVPATFVPQTGAVDKLALSFNGSTQRVSIPDATQFQLTQSLTLEAYIDVTKVPNTNAGQVGMIVFRGDDKADLDPYWLGIVGNKVQFQVDDAVGGFADVSFALPSLNKWTFVAGTLNATTGVMSLYINGGLVAHTTTTIRAYGVMTGADPGLGIGNIQDTSGPVYFPGLIDEVRISNVALAQNQLLNAKGAYTPGSIAGNVYHDFNGNGKVNPGEIGLANWTVFLDTNNNGIDLNETTVVTDVKGNYKFSGLVAGVTYHVREKINTGWLATAPITGEQDVKLGSGSNITGINFGDARPITVSGKVFADTNGDGVLDGTETGLAGFKVFIDLNSNGIQDPGENPITTTATGAFTFTGLRPGTFGIELISPAGYVLTTPIEYFTLAFSGLVESGINFGGQKTA